MKKTILLLVLYFSFSVLASPTEAPVNVTISVTENGFEPNAINVESGKKIVLKITRKTDNTCSTEIEIPDKKIKKDLPLNKTVTIDIGVLKKGEIRFGCGMNMMDSGKIYIK